MQKIYESYRINTTQVQLNSHLTPTKAAYRD